LHSQSFDYPSFSGATGSQPNLYKKALNRIDLKSRTGSSLGRVRPKALYGS